MKLKLFLLVLALQGAWILGTTLVQERALAQGRPILLETRPVDPRDPLRGDYVTLNYKISDVPANLFSPPIADALPDGRMVYVVVAPRGQFYEVVRASTGSFPPAGDEILLKGRSEHRLWGGRQPMAVHVEYGLERYYVREGTGNPRGKVTVQAVVSASGQARIKEVFVDGKPYAEAMKEAGR